MAITLDGTNGITTPDVDSDDLTVNGGDVTFYEDTGTTPKFFWDASAESLGIGTSSPSMALDVAGACNSGGQTGAYVLQTLYDTTAFALGVGGGIGFAGDAGPTTTDVTFGTINGIKENSSTGNYAGALTFKTRQNGAALTEAMRIDGSGNILIGATSVSSVQAGTVDGVSFRADSGARFFSRDNTSARYQIQFMNPNGSVGRIETSGSSTSYSTSSDYRLKTDAQPMTGASARVQALNPVNFEWIADGTRVDGFLAHEAQEVVPEAVTGTKDAMRDEEYEVTPAVFDDDGNVVTEAVMGTRSVPDYQAIDQSKLVPLLTAALQEALTEITDLKARVAALEAN